MGDEILFYLTVIAMPMTGVLCLATAVYLRLHHQKSKPTLLHCLRCMQSTEITGPEDMPAACPSCGAEFGARQTEPTGLISMPGTLTSDDVARIRSKWETAVRPHREARIGDECS
jgi:hypothetical protein